MFLITTSIFVNYIGLICNADLIVRIKIFRTSYLFHTYRSFQIDDYEVGILTEQRSINVSPSSDGIRFPFCCVF